MQADQILKDETCVSCGTVYWHGHHFDNNIEFELQTETCYGCQAKEAQEKQLRNEHGPKYDDSGETNYITTKAALDDQPLPSREEWLIAQHAEYQKKLAEEAKRKAAGDGS